VADGYSKFLSESSGMGPVPGVRGMAASNVRTRRMQGRAVARNKPLTRTTSQQAGPQSGSGGGGTGGGGGR